MTVVNVETGAAEVAAFKAQFMQALAAPVWELLGTDDQYIFDGLDANLIAYLRDRIAEHPELRTTLAQAADDRRRLSMVRRTENTKARLVYLIAADISGLIKIGSAVDPQARLRTLQTGSPEPLRLIDTRPGGEAHERELHRRFSHLRAHGEWFHPDADLIALIGGGA